MMNSFLYYLSYWLLSNAIAILAQGFPEGELIADIINIV